MPGGDLGDLDRVGEPGALVVVSGETNTWVLPARRRQGRECLIRSRSRSKHSRSGSGASGRNRTPGAHRPGRSRGQRDRQLGLPLLPLPYRRADEGLGALVGVADERGRDDVGHGPEVTTGV